VPLTATPDNIEGAIAFIDSRAAGGGTELLPALQRAFATPGGENRSRNVVIVTDGYVSVEREAFELIERNLGEANVYAFGIGTSVNRYLIEGMARAGRGEPFVVTNRLEAAARAGELRRYIETPVLTKTKLATVGFDIHDVEPPGIPDTLAQRPVVVFGKWRGERSGLLELEGLTGAGAFRQRFDVAKTQPSAANAALRFLWARSRIARLDDYQRLGDDPEVVKEITQLGLTYHLLTNYTSFIAVDQRVRNTRPEDSETARQPLPLPEGVSGSALGGAMPTSPEPELIWLIGVGGAVAAWASRRRRAAEKAGRRRAPDEAGRKRARES
jgi:Ca-activated chloride channel homolog